LGLFGPGVDHRYELDIAHRGEDPCVVLPEVTDTNYGDS
jgi:hypothetical protein